MALFVHLSPETNRRAILRSGIRPSRLRRPLQEGSERAVYAAPITSNFYATHQWLRELKRSGQRTIIGITFRIPDEEKVLLGRYNQAHQSCTAAEAIGRFTKLEKCDGYEVLIPRRIKKSEIHSIRHLPQLLGWRYYPDAKGRRPCPCPYCTKGDIKSKRIRQSSEESP
jgi:hypothetical protein